MDSNPMSRWCPVFVLRCETVQEFNHFTNILDLICTHIEVNFHSIFGNKVG